MMNKDIVSGKRHCFLFYFFKCDFCSVLSSINKDGFYWIGVIGGVEVSAVTICMFGYHGGLSGYFVSLLFGRTDPLTVDLTFLLEAVLEILTKPAWHLLLGNLRCTVKYCV